MRPRLIAIDGSVAVGKSTVGRLLAEKLGYSFVDTGTMYRALTWKALKSDIDLEDETKLSQLAATTKIEFVPASANNQDYCIFVDGEDVCRKIRSAEVEKNVSLVSKAAEVRREMMKEQRRMAQKGEVVMAGRDIGTVVLPEAELKVFLIASPEERAHRRYLELLNQGAEADYNTILADLMSRDKIDSQRAVSPLQPAADAKIIDTEGLTPEQVVQKILTLMEEQ